MQPPARRKPIRARFPPPADHATEHVESSQFGALIAERSVTRAAERMSVGQPAMSASLARLRTFFGDPLLVRKGRSLVPTPGTLELTASFQEALDLIDSTLRASRFEYSRKVPQQVRIRRDADTRSGTVTCGDGRGWTWCPLFATKGSGVRVPLAPLVKDIIRIIGTGCPVAKSSSRDRMNGKLPHLQRGRLRPHRGHPAAGPQQFRASTR